MNKTIIKLFFCYSIIYIFAGCNAFAKENVPYIVNANFVMEENFSEYEMCGVDLYFLNKADKPVKNFTVIFYLFDQDGEPVNTTKKNIAFTINEELEPMESLNLCLSLDKYINYIPENGCFIDYLYVSNITYCDNTVWSDPFGLKIF